MVATYLYNAYDDVVLAAAFAFVLVAAVVAFDDE